MLLSKWANDAACGTELPTNARIWSERQRLSESIPRSRRSGPARIQQFPSVESLSFAHEHAAADVAHQPVHARHQALAGHC